MNSCKFLGKNDYQESPEPRLRVIEAEYRHDPRWIELSASHPEGLIFHHPGWLYALESEYGQKCTALACEDADGKFQGILPLFGTRGCPLNKGSHRVGKRLSSLPRTPLGGPLTTSTEATALLIRAALERTLMAPASHLEIKSYDESLGRIVEALHPVMWRKSYVLHLGKETQYETTYRHATDLESNEKRGVRFGNSRNHLSIQCSVNKAVKAGVVAEVAVSDDDLRQWYKLYVENMRAVFVPARPYRFFQSLRNNLQHSGAFQLWSGRLGSQGEMIAGIIILRHGRTAVFAFAGAKRTEIWRNPYDLLHWSAIHKAWKDGYAYYDFGEVDDNDSGLKHYKKKWGTKELQMYRYYYPANQQREEIVPNYIGTFIRQAIRGMWQRVPLPVTSLVGECVYKFL